MRIVHLISNWKWTGPVEPALNTAWQQSSDHEVLFLSGTAPDGQDSKIQPHVDSKGVSSRSGLHLSKHARFRANREDVRSLEALLRDFRPDIVHTHMENDHRIASAAVAKTDQGLLVRTAYDPGGLSGSLRTRRTVHRRLDGLILTSHKGQEETLRAYGGTPEGLSVAGKTCPLAMVEGGIDLHRFDPSRYDREEGRALLGLEPDHVAIGIVARVQSHRRFELLLEAFGAVVARHPQARLVVVGRGTHRQTLLMDPAVSMGIGDKVLAPGYLEGDRYPTALRGLDACLFLVPGSDGTCRALREQMALGLAPLVFPRDPLPEIVASGDCGMVVEESAEALEKGLEELVANPELREGLGKAARTAAEDRFEAKCQAEKVVAFYDQIMDVAAREGTAAS
ncbi:MAG: glycosyltransferase family 4 protein [Planctomycetota bacterium]|nr:glycosyltransferase family 4 protein [Planctomycetota bacterium]